jgi:hypothetical protein
MNRKSLNGLAILALFSGRVGAMYSSRERFKTLPTGQAGVPYKEFWFLPGFTKGLQD